MDFVTGDVVVLRSGSPEMVVVTVWRDISEKYAPQCECAWFSGDELHNATFPAPCVRKA